MYSQDVEVIQFFLEGDNQPYLTLQESDMINFSGWEGKEIERWGILPDGLPEAALPFKDGIYIDYSQPVSEPSEPIIHDFIIPDWAIPAIMDNDYSGLSAYQQSVITTHISKFGDSASINGKSFQCMNNDLTGVGPCVCYDVAFLQTN